MGIALLGISSLYKGVQQFMHAGSHLDAINVKAPALKVPPVQSFKRASPSRALRVLRISEQGDHPQSAGRMVISGRMADVCAELDRLIALEDRSIKPANLLNH